MRAKIIVFMLVLLGSNMNMHVFGNEFNLPVPPPPPTNDECINAIPLTVGTTCNYVQYTNASATASAGVTAPGCASYSGGDVWFSVVVPVGGRLIIDTQTGVISDGGMALYSGTCGSLTLIECDDDDSNNGNMPYIDRTGLTVGSTVYIRVWEYSNDNNGTFSICVRTIAPITNDECATAIPLTANSSSTCTSIGSGSVAGATASAQTNSCSGTDDDDVWFSFVAVSTTHFITLSNVTGSTTDMYFAAYSGTCGSLTNLVCSDANSNSISGLTIGNTYYIRVYTYTSTAGQTSSFDICVSSPSQNAACSGADPFCTGTAYLFPANVDAGSAEVGPNYGCLCSQPNPVWYYLRIANPGSLTINISSTAGDVDYAAWGPFSALTCDPADLTSTGTSCTTTPYSAPAGNMVDCSYSTASSEVLTIPSALTGQYYMVMITNFSNSSGNITFNQASGTGSTDCSIIAPPVSNNGPLCVGQTLNLTVTSPTSGATYSWDGPNGFTSSTMNPSIPSVTLANAGVYSLEITVGGVTSAPVTTTVVVNAAPTPTAGSNSAICAGSTLNLTSSGGTSYSWSGPNGFTDATQNPSITSATTAASGVYTVTVTATGGCTATAQTTVTINAMPTPTAGNNSPICAGTTLNLTSSGGTSYAWSGPNSFTSAIQNPSITAATTAASGTYTVTVTATGGCTATAQTTVTTNGTLSFVPTSNSPICENQTLNLNSPIVGGTYSWSGPNSFTSAIQNPTVTSTTVAATGTYNVTITDANGCSGTGSVSVTINPLPIPTISGNNTICFGNNTSLTASGGNSYSWSNGPAVATITVSPTIQTTYTVTVTATGGCTATTSQMVFVNANPVIDNIATTNELCNLQNGQAVATVSQGTAPYQYTWSNGAPNNSTLPTIGAGQYLVTITDANGCTTTSTFAIQNIPGPQLSLASMSPDHCDQGIGSASVSVNTSGTYTYSWLTTPPQMGNTATNLTSGTYLVAVTDGTCADTLAVIVSNMPNPIADFEPNPPSASSSNSVIRFMNQSVGGSTYLWTFGDGSNSTETSPLHEYIGTNTYTVTLLVTDAYGCFDTISKTVMIYDDMNVFIPNAFSPNSDNNNEEFRPYGSGINLEKPYEMMIYDRWGALVFTSNKFEKGWDGTISGTKGKMNGVFTYRITLYDYTNKQHIYVGSFSLLGSKYNGDF